MIEKLSKFFIGILVGLILTLLIFVAIVAIVAKVQDTTIYHLFNLSVNNMEGITLCLKATL